MNKLKLTTLLLFLLILPQAKAISLGTVLKKDYATIKANESTKFEILFWNVEEETYEIQVEVDKALKDWFIKIEPQKFLLNSSAGKEYINLPNFEKPVKASVVNIFVKPENTEPGEYKILVRAKAGLPSQGIAFFQEREFELKVKIEGKTQEVENKTLAMSEENFYFKGKSVGEISPTLSYILAIICILVISALIYKYA
ncbi:MAG: hypothetical protein QW040_00095 [Candidatus Aenigmatarchaeota archaeon]